MKLTRCSVQNFGSYANLDFDFSNIGLGLVYGPTGSGKSTLMDVAAWVLYGITAKGGNADEVRSWQGTGPTRGELEVLAAGDVRLNVVRVRGGGSKNDLYWTEGDSDTPIRGKDLAETQKLLSARLGCSEDLFLTGAYFHEFSETAAFFTAKSKDRRAVFERIANLDLAVRLADKASGRRKDARRELDDISGNKAKSDGRVEQLGRTRQSTIRERDSWDASHSKNILALERRAETFDADKEAQIEKLVSQLEADEAKLKEDSYFAAEIEKALQGARNCPECGQPNRKHNEHISALKDARSQNARLGDRFKYGQEQLRKLVDTQNTYAEQAEAERAKTNPFTPVLEKLEADIKAAEEESSRLKAECDRLEHRVASLSTLYDLSFTLRGELLRKAVREIETATNAYLEEYFDAELRVAFTLDGDDLEVAIQKSGYDCVYRQLSKGQRGLLKLCFSVAVMKAAANNAGVHFANLYFDEALDGLDANLKVKAFRLFEELETEHESVLLIEHATEFRSLFARQYKVTMTGDASEIALEE